MATATNYWHKQSFLSTDGAKFHRICETIQLLKEKFPWLVVSRNGNYQFTNLFLMVIRNWESIQLSQVEEDILTISFSKHLLVSQLHQIIYFILIILLSPIFIGQKNLYFQKFSLKSIILWKIFSNILETFQLVI